MARCSFLVFIFAATGSVSAQQPKDTTYIKPGQYLLEEMVISASRWEQNPARIPATITSLNQSEVQLQNPQTAADLLGLVDGVFIQKSQQGGGSPVIRGFGANRVLLVVDGVRLNNAVFRSGNVQQVISLDANTIARTEVIFGPGSVIYGSDAIGGVMDFHTLSPVVGEDGRFLKEANVMGRYSSANHEKTVHADLNFGTGKWGFVSSVTRSVFEDLRTGSKGPDFYSRPDYVIRAMNDDLIVRNDDVNVQTPGGYDQANVMQKIMFRRSENVAFTYAFHHSKTSDYSRYDRLLVRDEDDRLANAEWFYGPQKWTMQNLSMDMSKPTLFWDGMKAVLAFQNFRESRHNRPLGGPARTNRVEKVKAISLNVDAEKKLGNQTHLFWGGEFVSNFLRSSAFSLNVNTAERNAISTRYPDGSVWRAFALYSGIQKKIGTRWNLSTSIRYTAVETRAEFDKTFFPFPFDNVHLKNNAVNGSVGATWNFDAGSKWYANLSTGFRAPNIDDIGKVFDSSPGTLVVPNEDVKPEYAYSIETGAGSSTGPLRYSFSVYYTLLRHALSRGEFLFEGNEFLEYDGVLSRVFAIQNLDEAEVYGAQVALQWNLSSYLKASGALNVQAGREEDGNSGEKRTPSHVPPHNANLSLRYTSKRFTAVVFCNMNAKVPFRNMPLSERADSFLYLTDQQGNPYTPSWITLNFKSSIRINGNISIDAGVENVLDKRYRPFSSGISAPGRNFIFGVRGSLQKNENK